MCSDILNTCFKYDLNIFSILSAVYNMMAKTYASLMGIYENWELSVYCVSE
jgi:hypothetical protein